MVKPSQEHFRIKSISQIRKLISSRNQVLVKTLDKNEDSRTPSGIYKVGDTDFNPAKHANRISEVIMVPDTLYYGLTWHKVYPKASESMPWRTDMELQVGDIIWHDYMNSLNCAVIDVDDERDEQYKLLNYYDIYVAKRKIVLDVWAEGEYHDSRGSCVIMNGVRYGGIMEGEDIIAVIPLNGYVLCEEVLEERKSSMDVLEKHVDQRFGRVAFMGKKNYGYRRERIRKPPVEMDFDGDMDLTPGDIIVKKNPKIHIMLEDPVHCRFNCDTMYFVIQRKDIYGKKC